MTAKHTPGPWQAEPMEDGCSVSFRINDAAGYEIGVTSGRDNEGEEDANACLMAAAPGMLDALKQLLRAGIVNPAGSARLGTAIEYARIAVAKAEGRQP